MQQLQSLSLSEKDAHLRPSANADHDRGRRGEAHGAGAGDNQNRHSVHQPECQRRIGPEQKPDAECQQRERDDRRDEIHRHPIHHRLDRDFPALGVLDHPDDLREHGVSANGGGAEDQVSILVDRSAYDSGAGGLRHRNRLSGDHAFIHVAFTFGHFAVHRQPFARTDFDQIADGDFRHIHLKALAAALNAGRFRGEPHQPLDRLRRAPLRPRLHPASDQDQRHDNGGGLIVYVHRGVRQKAWRKGRDYGEKISCARADRDQAVHVRSAARESRQASSEESPARPGEHRRGEGQLDQPAGLHADRRHDKMVHSRDQMAAHLQHENRQCEQTRRQNAAPEAARFVFSLGDAVNRGVFVPKRARDLTLERDRGDQLFWLSDSRDHRLFGRQIDIGRGDAGDGAKGAFNPRRAARACHALNGEGQSARRYRVALILDRFHQQSGVEVALRADAGALGRQIHTRFFHAR